MDEKREREDAIENVHYFEKSPLKKRPTLSKAGSVSRTNATFWEISSTEDLFEKADALFMVENGLKQVDLSWKSRKKYIEDDVNSAISCSKTAFLKCVDSIEETFNSLLDQGLTSGDNDCLALAYLETKLSALSDRQYKPTRTIMKSLIHKVLLNDKSAEGKSGAAVLRLRLIDRCLRFWPPIDEKSRIYWMVCFADYGKQKTNDGAKKPVQRQKAVEELCRFFETTAFRSITKVATLLKNTQHEDFPDMCRRGADVRATFHEFALLCSLMEYDFVAASLSDSKRRNEQLVCQPLVSQLLRSGNIMATLENLLDSVGPFTAVEFLAEVGKFVAVLGEAERIFHAGEWADEKALLCLEKLPRKALYFSRDLAEFMAKREANVSFFRRFVLNYIETPWMQLTMLDFLLPKYSNPFACDIAIEKLCKRYNVKQDDLKVMLRKSCWPRC